MKDRCTPAFSYVVGLTAHLMERYYFHSSLKGLKEAVLQTCLSLQIAILASPAK